MIQRLIANLKLLNQHGSAIFRQQLAVRQRYSASSVPNVLSKRQQAALTSAYALLNDSYNNYKDKLKELYGEEAHQKIVDAIAAENG